MSQDLPILVVIDIGNTHIHIGWHRSGSWLEVAEIRTDALRRAVHPEWEALWHRHPVPAWAGFCSVVPEASKSLRSWLASQSLLHGFTELGPENVRHLGIDYPKPETIGPDRLANAIAAAYHHGAPSVVVDFGTAVTFDVVDTEGRYVGGIIAPGITVMTDYLHEKTALLPRIKVAEPDAVVGKNTEQAMQIGAVHGYRGLIKELIQHLEKDLGVPHLPVIATGGYADLIANGLEALHTVRPHLTLEGLLLLAPSTDQNPQTSPPGTSASSELESNST